jgi:hypothetical protein
MKRNYLLNVIAFTVAIQTALCMKSSVEECFTFYYPECSNLPVQFQSKLIQVFPTVEGFIKKTLYGFDLAFYGLEERFAFSSVKECLHLQVLLYEFEGDKKAFMQNASKVSLLSDILHSLVYSTNAYDIVKAYFYYPPTECSYYHYERKEFFPNVQWLSTFIQIASKFSMMIEPVKKTQRSLHFVQKFDGVLAPANKEYERECIKGLINYIVNESKKAQENIVEDIRNAFQDLDNDPDRFLRNYENMYELEKKLYTLISAIDVYEINASGVKKEFYPNMLVAKKLLDIAKQLELLIKSRRLGVSVVDTFVMQ